MQLHTNTKALFTVVAVFESATGAALLTAPSLTAELLLGAGLGSPEGILVGRIAGAALFAIGLTCWLERSHSQRSPRPPLVVGLLAYNALATVLLASAATIGQMDGIGLWPAIALHTTIAIWCVACAYFDIGTA